MLTSKVMDIIDDILMVLEAKLDSFFPNAQFVIEEYVPSFIYDRNCHDSGILLYITKDIL